MNEQESLAGLGFRLGLEPSRDFLEKVGVGLG
jgi:hypothetical protein